MITVSPDGNRHAKYVICGEAPAREEVAQGRGFVGPSGRIVWPVLRRLAGLNREDCWVTNLCKHPLDNDESGDAKLSPEEFEACRFDLHAELSKLPNVERVLAVGALAAKALIGFRWCGMTVNNGMSYVLNHPATGAPLTVTPCWHPAAALRGGTGERDPIAWMGDAMAHFLMPRFQRRLDVPDWESAGFHIGEGALVGIDTEGLASSPECFTLANERQRVIYEPRDAARVFLMLRSRKVTLAYHNAPWDWKVLEAMGVHEPWRIPFRDTMELAYLRQTEPQGLKDLGCRHFGVDMPSWEEVVMPRYAEIVGNAVAGRVEAGTTVTTHSPKTGKAYKKPRVARTPEAAKLVRLKDPAKQAAAIGFEKPSLLLCPWDEMAEYATLDPFVTRALVKVLG